MSHPMRGRRCLMALVALALLSACAAGAGATPRTPEAGVPPLPTARAAGSCHIATGRPDPLCQPGAVQAGVTAATICAPGYTTRTIRPPASYTTGLKTVQIAEYGDADTNPADYEEDHLIPLELAGDPVSPANLWPQPRAGEPNAAEKDAVENAAKKAVCEGKMPLADAQRQIAKDWTALRAELLAGGMFTAADPSAPLPTEP